MTESTAGGETARLNALRRLAILDTPEEARFDRITQLAARLFGTRVALLSLVDSERQWFKSAHGLNVKETARSASFCSHAIHADDVMVVEDASDDPRFAHNPLVTGAPHIRFYAGAPLRTLDNLVVGTLCLVDPEPRHFSADERELLRSLAVWAESEINAQEARAARVAAYESNVRLQALVDHISDALIVCTASGVIESANPAAGRLFGYDCIALIGSNMRTLMHEPYHSAANGYELYMSEYEVGRFVAGELARRADNTQLPIERRVDWLALADRNLHCHLIRDVSDRQELENAKATFLAEAAHEMRSPLASIHGFSELLVQRPFEPTRQREMLSIMYQQAAHMTRLINELLDLARMEARGTRAFEMRDISISDLIKEIVAGFMVPPGRSRARLQIAPGLPDVFVDPDKIQQALCNVLSNAYKYSPGGGEVTIEVQRYGKNHLAIIVSDLGLGMTAEVMRCAFDRFYRADQHSTIRGTGLGLSLVKEIIEHHGGQVTLASHPGSGTSVMATLLIRSAR